MADFITRFAPSPTGPLHLGHAYSALLAHDMAMDANGTFLLRIDDLDQSRARAKWEAQLKDDLGWLGLDWPEPCRKETQCQAEYDAALDQLWHMGLLYPCTCTRRDIREAASAPQEGAPMTGPDGIIYPGTCRKAVDQETPRPSGATLRLNMAAALKTTAIPLGFVETGPDLAGDIDMAPDVMRDHVGDVVLARKDMGAAYHLAVVIDDAAQGITHVIRGADLFDATYIHVLLQHLLGLPQPIYHHHRLIRDDTGKRLAKRDDSKAIAKYRSEGATPYDIRRMTGLGDTPSRT